MRFDIITIFPDIFDSYLNESILKRGQKQNLIKIKIHNLRDFSKDKHRKVDDRPYGGGPGMVIKVEPLIKAINSILNFKQTLTLKNKKPKIILFSPAGEQFSNKIAAQLAKNSKHLILICGHYEGIDERIKKILHNSNFKPKEISIGPYVLTGGELPAMVLIDAVCRQIPGVLGKQESLEEKRLGIGVPTYTRPEIFVYNSSHQTKFNSAKEKKYPVPKILLSGNPKEIAGWRRSKQKNLS